MNLNEQQKAINSKIKTLSKAEAVTKAVLGELSRDLLQYVLIDQSHDVDAIHRCFEVLTPVNRKVAELFFQAFIPHKFDKDAKRFGKLDAKKKEQLLVDVAAKLSNPDFNIWSWAADNIEVDKKPTDFIGNIKKAITAGLTKGELSQHEIIKAALEAGLDLSALVTIMQSAVNADAAPEQVVNAPKTADGSDINAVC